MYLYTLFYCQKDICDLPYRGFINKNEEKGRKKEKFSPKRSTLQMLWDLLELISVADKDLRKDEIKNDTTVNSGNTVANNYFAVASCRMTALIFNLCNIHNELCLQ